jgi:hypothetical protein
LFLAWTASGSTVIGGRGFPCPQKAQSAAVVKSEYPSLIPWGWVLMMVSTVISFLFVEKKERPTTRPERRRQELNRE